MKLYLCIFRKWLTDCGETRDILALTPANLDVYVGGYIRTGTFKNKDGLDCEYEPDTLTSHFRALDTFLKDNHYGGNMSLMNLEHAGKCLQQREKS